MYQKLETLECLLDNQRKFLEDHGVKIKEIENVIHKLTAEHEEKEKQTEKGKKYNQLYIKDVSANALVILDNWNKSEFVIANNFMV